MTLPIGRNDEVNRPEQNRPPSPWDPFAPFGDIYQRMGEFVRAVRDDFDTRWWSPPVDIEESDDAFIVEADLPGVARDDLTIDWSGRDLAIHGEVRERERTGLVRQQLRRTGSFHYTVALPGDIDADNITADLRDGVLTITAPKTQTTKSRRIELRHTEP